MGSFITNLHVRDAAPRAVIEALKSLGVVPAYVRGSPADAWTSIFPQAAFQDEAGLSALALALSSALQRPVIAFIVHDSDILLYLLVDDGKQRDSYNSAPGYFTGENLPPEGGEPEALATYCRADNATDQLSRLLHPERHSADQAQSSGQTEHEMILDAVRKKAIQAYPIIAAKMPNPPSLEQYLADIERRMATRPAATVPTPSPAKPFMFAEDRLTGPAELLGIPSGRALDSYHYLSGGEGTPGMLTLIGPDGETEISLS
ncbi:hypothetical protein [Bradyrhizobium sp. SZCCHNRI1009]|uniref:hypothetical protein n=1 Tax=Bradyrhizobium sp. SZCCHNRI1009 TaxID=3057277 RepID=UPI00291708A1|nr:hypothetical protein [Bradyrhizobium sp. SZCCHNRI1009]